jgi:hypothetical protein
MCPEKIDRFRKNVKRGSSVILRPCVGKISFVWTPIGLIEFREASKQAYYPDSAVEVILLIARAFKKTAVEELCKLLFDYALNTQILLIENYNQKSV